MDSTKMALDALTALYRGYVNTQEHGRDRIISLGGQCDPLDKMEASDPWLISARAAIAALEAQPTGWMPIESAPKDKVLLLGYFNAARKWVTVRGEWFSQEEIDDQWEFPEFGEPGWYETCYNADEPPNCWPIEPTHWMPLPATPPKD